MVLGSILGLVVRWLFNFISRWLFIFWINIPIGVIGVIWSYKYLKELGSIRREKIDWLGICFIWSRIIFYTCRNNNMVIWYHINFLIIFLLIFGGFSLLIIFGLIEKYISKEYPMFHFSLFKIKTFLGGNIAIFLNSIARGNFIFLISIYLQGALIHLKVQILLK